MRFVRALWLILPLTLLALALPGCVLATVRTLEAVPTHTATPEDVILRAEQVTRIYPGTVALDQKESQTQWLKHHPARLTRAAPKGVAHHDRTGTQTQVGSLPQDHSEDHPSR